MAVLVDIERLVDEATHADYSFVVGEASRAGVLRIDKNSGGVTLVAPMQGSANAEAHFRRAAHKIEQHWRRGHLPKTTVWAS